MATTAINPRAIASILGGDVTGRDSVLVPGPVHSKPDRSLSIKVDPTAPLGFRVYSCCRPQNDWQTCRDYVCAALGLRRDSVPPKVRKAPAVAAKIHSMVAMAPEGLTGLRDRALLLLGFAGAFRRSELVALNVADIEEMETGLLVTIRCSKTDRKAKASPSRLRGATCPALPRPSGNGWTQPVSRRARSSGPSTRLVRSLRCG